MQLTFKTLSRKVFNIEVESEKSVADLKLKIEKEHGSEFPADRLKLILKGKVLDNEQIISTLSYVEKSFILLMVIKEPPKLSQSKLSEKKEKSEIKLTNETIHNLPGQISLSLTDGNNPDESNELSDNEDQSDSEDNSLSTVELLIKFPDDEDMSDLMEKFQERLNEDPSLLQRMIEDVGNDPEMSQILSVDPNDDEFSDNSQDEYESDDGLDDKDAHILSQDDIKNVDIITAMGFDEQLAVEAYLVCGRDIVAAINFLLSNTE